MPRGLLPPPAHPLVPHLLKILGVDPAFPLFPSVPDVRRVLIRHLSVRSIIMKHIVILGLFALFATACSKHEAAIESSPTAEIVSTDSAKPYPLDVCIVAGKALGSMGDPVVIVHEGQEIKFCCDSCQPKFEANPAKYLVKLSEKDE